MLFILKHYIKDLAYCMHAIINISCPTLCHYKCFR